MRKRLPISLATFLFLAGSTAFGQLNQLNGGGANAAAGGGQTGENAGGTTQAAGGVTGQAPGAAANEAIAGANAAQAFIGGPNTDGNFVGGGLETLFNQANRNFRAITQGQTPEGGTRNTSGTPRQVPVSLRIGFSVPTQPGANVLASPGGQAIQRIAGLKPELRNVTVTVNELGVATISGSTPDQASKQLALNIVRLRPGVRRINNKLLVSADQ